MITPKQRHGIFHDIPRQVTPDQCSGSRSVVTGVSLRTFPCSFGTYRPPRGPADLEETPAVRVPHPLHVPWIRHIGHLGRGETGSHQEPLKDTSGVALVEQRKKFTVCRCRRALVCIDLQW